MYRQRYKHLEIDLFLSYKERLISYSVFSVLLFIHLGYLYIQYQKWVEFDTIEIKAIVLDQYQKQNKKQKFYTVLKLRSKNNYTFYTSTRSKIKNIIGYEVDLLLFTKNLRFIDTLKTFYIYSAFKGINQQKTLYSIASKKIKDQHKNPILQSFFSALFLATPIHKKERKILSAYGINHLLAISGYHLGFLSLMLFFLFKFPYQYFQKNYFPFRSLHYDLGLFILVILFIYVYFINFYPPVFRSFIMMLIAYIFYRNHIKILNYENLFLVIFIIAILLPSMIFSLSFWFSILGVFFILLYLQYVKNKNIIYNTIAIHFFLFLSMLPLSHIIFNNPSPTHIVSLFLNFIFLFFYPLEILFHIFSYAFLLDPILEYCINIPIVHTLWHLPFYSLYIYLFLALISTLHKNIFILFNIALILYFFTFIMQKIIN
jgi:competence protein ComEC